MDDNNQLPNDLPKPEVRKPEVEAEEGGKTDQVASSFESRPATEGPTEQSGPISEAKPEVVEEKKFAHPAFSLPETNTTPKSPSFSIKGVLPFIGGGLLVILLAFLLFNFLGKGNKKGEVVTLNYWGLWEPEPVIQGVIAEWEKENPKIKVKYINQDKEDYQARLQSAFSRNEGPDIFRFHNAWLPVLKDQLAPVPETVVDLLALKSAYFSVVTESITKGDLFYGVPLMVDTLALFYNKDILSRANKSLPRTWWGLENLAKDLTVRVNQKISVAGVALGSVSNVDHWSDIIGLMIYQNNGDPSQPDALVEDVIKYYLRFKNADLVWDESLPRSTMAFADGKLAFYFAPSWRVFNLLEANPNLNFGVTTVPQLPKLKDTDWEAAERGEKELTNINWATFWVEGVWLKSDHQKEAWKFLEFLGSKEVIQKLYSAQSQVRLFGEIYPRIDLASNLKEDPIIGPFVNQSESAKTWYLCSFTHDAAINDRVIKYYEDAINAFSEVAPRPDVLETLNSGVKQVLAQYGEK